MEERLWILWKLIISQKEDGDTVVDSGGNVYIVGSGGTLIKVKKGENGSHSYSDDAIHDPSNVDYIPEYDPLLISEPDSVLGKTMIVGGSAVLMMDSGKESDIEIICIMEFC